MIDWLTALRDLERCHLPALLVTVTSVAGSAPREPGARMIVTACDLQGSIGGGRLEHDAVELARAMRAAGDAVVTRRVALGPQLGQCCGGVVNLVFERIDDTAWCATVEKHVGAGLACVIATVLDAGSAECPPLGAKLVVTESGATGNWGDAALEAEVVRTARRLLGNGRATTTIGIAGRAILLDPVIREPPIVVFGAGHVGRALISILGVLPCPVLWIDGRAEQFPPALPANVSAEVSDAPELEVAVAPAGSLFVVMTHSHQLDLAICERILRRGDFAYFGLIGSAAKRRRFERRLQLRGIGADILARMHCPIGIPGLHGKHPGEIAVAVAAELQQVRSRRATAALSIAPGANSRIA